MYKKMIYLTSIALVLCLTSKGWPKASNPLPSDGAVHDATWVSLSWQPGDLAVSFDIYVGENYDDVKYGTGETFKGNQATMFFILGFPGFPYEDGLVPGTTYYWRVDEVNREHPDSPWVGDVWSFKITPSTAHDPEPADGAELVESNVILSWEPGFRAKLHTVFFGDNFAEVNHAIEGHPQGDTTYNPGLLELGKTYYWRVDEFDGRETYKGDVWSFTVGTEGTPPGEEEGIFYVDAVNGNDHNNGLRPRTAFATISKGIDAAADGDTVLVYPGLYLEEINYLGKAITVQGVAVSPAGVPVLWNPGDFAVSFYSGEGSDSVLKNFIIKDSFMGVFIADSSPTLSNLTVVSNTYGIEAYADSEPDISNTILWYNTNGDLFGCQARYSFIQEARGPLEGLVSYWKFDEDEGSVAYDSAGDNHGTIHGARRTAGQINGALSFDGEDDYVELPDNNPVWLPQFDFSFSVWIYFERETISLPSEQEVILDFNYAASADSENELGYNVLRRSESRKLCFQMTTTTSSDEDLDSNEVLAAHRWHHVVCVREGATQAMYINGTLDGRRACSPDPITFVGGYDDNRINIGRFTTTIGSPRYHLKGKVDELMIFDRALSAGEIQQLYQGSNGLTADPLFVDPAHDDYHLRSERGRYWPRFDIWVLDKVTSPCIDVGDPDADISNEPMPNGGRINIGAYGGTAEASLSPIEQPSSQSSQASNPDPADDTFYVGEHVTLNWTAGLKAVSHDIYFSIALGGSNTGKEAVTNADTSDNTEIYRGRQTATSYTLPEDIGLSTAYCFWRIDEVDSEGNITRGDVWTFELISRGRAPKGRACFTADTGVWIDGAIVSISKVTQGQINCGMKNFGKIQEVQEHNGTFTCYDVMLESGNSIGVAENHYFLSESGQWISVKQLKTGIKLKTSKGLIGITSATKRPIPYVGNVYNLNIAGSDRYLVGKDAVIVRDY